MTDSAERTRDLLNRAIYDPGRLTEREGLIGDADDLEPLHVMQARACMAALLSDPTLLVDLVLEAGGLEPILWDCPHDGRVNVEGCPRNHEHSPVVFERVYRRKEKTEP